MDQSLVHTFSWGNSYGPMVLKVLQKFPLHWYWSMDGSSQLRTTSRRSTTRFALEALEVSNAYTCWRNEKDSLKVLYIFGQLQPKVRNYQEVTAPRIILCTWWLLRQQTLPFKVCEIYVIPEKMILMEFPMAPKTFVRFLLFKYFVLHKGLEDGQSGAIHSYFWNLCNKAIMQSELRSEEERLRDVSITLPFYKATQAVRAR